MGREGHRVYGGTCRHTGACVRGGYYRFSGYRGGAVFNLGKSNTVDAISKLVGTTTSSMLMVDNNGSGTAPDLRVGSSSASPATKTTPPMKVDSRAEVANLHAQFAGQADNAAHADQADHATNADNAADAGTLDGQNSTDFAPAAHVHSGLDISSGTVAEARIDDAVARDGEVMPIVKANDGSGSNLDADLLDGKNSTAFVEQGDVMYATVFAAGGRLLKCKHTGHNSVA